MPGGSPQLRVLRHSGWTQSQKTKHGSPSWWTQPPSFLPHSVMAETVLLWLFWLLSKQLRYRVWGQLLRCLMTLCTWVGLGKLKSSVCKWMLMSIESQIQRMSLLIEHLSLQRWDLVLQSSSLWQKQFLCQSLHFYWMPRERSKKRERERRCPK